MCRSILSSLTSAVNASRGYILTLLSIGIWIALTGPTIAESLSNTYSWVRDKADLYEALTNRPTLSYQRPDQPDERFLVDLGELLFHAPDILGEEAQRTGLSCATCHPGGATARWFFVEQVSDRPGNVDLTSSIFHPPADDGLDNPINIPSLRGVGKTAPYGFDGRFPTLREVLQHVVETETGGDALSLLAEDSLVAFLDSLRLPSSPTDFNHDARRGRYVFNRADIGCANCHDPLRSLTDGHTYVIDGVSLDTPTLAGLSETGPYLFDGRALTLRDAIETHIASLSIEISPEDLEALTSYLASLGAAPSPTSPTPKTDLLQTGRFIGVTAELAKRQEDALAQLALRHSRRSLEGIYDRILDQGLRNRLLYWSRILASLAAHPLGDWQTPLTIIGSEIDDSIPVFMESAPQSLYQTEHLARYISYESALPTPMIGE